MALPCREAARWLLTDQAGDTRHVCDGHATAARAQLIGAHVVPLPDREDV
ncbi:hypothetical protein [Actinomadura sp. 7K507]|nr:hypothetical protein [Actinomadura sp. 7K507]